MRLSLSHTVAAVAAVALLVACNKSKEVATPVLAVVPSDASIVRIGHAAPTSGSTAHLGKDTENGVRMAIEELNAAGVIIGDKKVTLELVAQDDAGDPEQGVAVAKKMVATKVAGVVGHMDSGTTIPASKIYSENGIPQISPSATNPKYTRQGFKTAFRVVADDAQLGSALGRYAVGTLKGKFIAVIDDRTAYGEGVANEFSKAVETAGGNVVARESTTDKAVGIKSLLTSIKEKKPDVIFFGGLDAVAGPLLKEMKSLGIKAKFVGGDGICDAELIPLSGDAIADDQVYCAEAGGVEGDDRAVLDQFKAKYKEKFKIEDQSSAAYAYDATRILVAAMVKAKSSDPSVYLPALASTTDFKGVTGPVSFDEKGDIRDGALTLKTVRSGKLETLAVIR